MTLICLLNMCPQIIDIHNIIMMQVETRDAHLPHTLWRNDYHIVGCEDDIVFEFVWSSGDWGRR